MTAFQSYSDLQRTVKQWVGRSDLTLTLPSFISMTEAVMNRVLRTRKMVTRATETISDEYLSLPDNFVAILRVALSTDGTSPGLTERLKYVAPDALQQIKATRTYASDAVPELFTVTGYEMQFWPPPATGLLAEILYWKTIPPLSDNNTSNWVLELYPDLYLYGTLQHAHAYLGNVDRVEGYRKLFADTIAEANGSDPVPADNTELSMDGALLGGGRFNIQTGI